MKVNKDVSVMKLLLLLLLHLILICSVRAIIKTIDWHNGVTVRWAHDCDVKGDDVEVHKARGEDCGSLCVTVSRKWCNSFVWTDENGGTCRLKRGGVAERLNTGGICGEVVYHPETG